MSERLTDGLAFRTVCDGSDAGCSSCCSRLLCSSLVLAHACVLSEVEILRSPVPLHRKSAEVFLRKNVRVSRNDARLELVWHRPHTDARTGPGCPLIVPACALSALRSPPPDRGTVEHGFGSSSRCAEAPSLGRWRW